MLHESHWSIHHEMGDIADVNISGIYTETVLPIARVNAVMHKNIMCMYMCSINTSVAGMFT
jgi:hypothetical protein